MKFGLEVAAVAALVVLSAATVTVGEQEKHTLYFVSFLSYPDLRPTFQATWQDAEEIVTSGYLALDHINNRTDILNDYTIRLIESDGGCNLRTRTVVGFAESGILSSSKQIVGVVGPSCADSSATVAPLTSRNEVALITIHYGSLPQLGDRTKYPYAFGAMDSFDVYAEGVTELMKNRMWKRVAILYTDGDVEFSDVFRTTEKWIKELPDYEIAFSSVIFETYLPLQQIKESFAPVIVVFAGIAITKRLMCMAYHEGMVYPTHQWVFMDRRLSDFDHTELSYDGQKYTCTAAEMMNVAVNGGISFVLDVSTTTNTTVSGQSYEEYLHNYQEKAEMHNASTTDWANTYYDAIWALALALNASLQELQNRNFSLTEYRRGKPSITDIIAHHMYKLDFEGVSGRIKFEQETGFDNRTLIGYQFINGSEEKAVVYSSGKLVLYSQEFVRGEFNPRYDRVAIPVAVVLLLLILITLPPAITAQIINVMRPDYRTIKASSPRINHIGFAGYYLLVLSIIWHTITVTFWLSDGTQGVLCNLVPWFMSIGLSLMLGTVCLKTWRIYHIFLIADKLIKVEQGLQVHIHKDYFLALIILLQPTVDVLICTLWVVIDPFTSEEIQVFQYEQGTGVPVVVHQKICHSQLTVYWLVVLGGHKALIILSSLFFAILARKVRWKQFQTKNVTILVYLLSITCGLGIPLYLTTYLLQLNINIPYFLLCATLATLLYLCLTLLFLPPLYPLLKERLMHHGVWPKVSYKHSQCTDLVT